MRDSARNDTNLRLGGAHLAVLHEQMGREMSGMMLDLLPCCQIHLWGSYMPILSSGCLPRYESTGFLGWRKEGRKEGRDMGTKEDIVCWLGDHFLGF